MKQQSVNMAHRIGLIRGFGIGLIVAAGLFFIVLNQVPVESDTDISDEEFISRANALGMIQIKQVENVYLTDEDIINKAKELGMIMPDENKTNQIE